MKQAQCPECGEWSEVAIVQEAPLGVWWRDSDGCPSCSALVCVETECEFREVKP